MEQKPNEDLELFIQPGPEKKPRKTRKERIQSRQKNQFDIEKDPDYPPTAVNSHVTVEEVEINASKQRLTQKRYQLVDGTIKDVTRFELL